MEIHKLRKHIEGENKHMENEPSLECKECGKSLSSETKLRNHMSRVESVPISAASAVNASARPAI